MGNDWVFCYWETKQVIPYNIFLLRGCPGHLHNWVRRFQPSASTEVYIHVRP